MDGLTIAREVANKLDLIITDEQLEGLMWEETGWPAFFAGDPETVFRQQMLDALTGTTN